MKITKLFSIAGVLVGAYLALRDMLQDHPEFKERATALLKDNFDKVKGLIGELTDDNDSPALGAGYEDQSASGDQSSGV